MDPVIVIGYGNELRGDDAIGPQVARAVAAWDLPGVRALAAHQLTPELAEALAQARAAIFVDARRAEPADLAVRLNPIAPHNQAQLAGHLGDPSALLALADAVYGRHPRAWLISVPASSFAYGAELSYGARTGLASALQLIRYLVTFSMLRGEGVGEVAAPPNEPYHPLPAAAPPEADGTKVSWSDCSSPGIPPERTSPWS